MLGNERWQADGLLICPPWSSPSDMVADGSGGVIVAFKRHYNVTGRADVHAARIDTAGANMWGSLCSMPICTTLGSQGNARLVSDGLGGAIVTWVDERSDAGDIYAQRINSLGNVLWQVNGLPITSAAGYQTTPVIETDGKGGAIIWWHDVASSLTRVQRIDSGGVLKWNANGVTVSPGAARYPLEILSDDEGGVILAWADTRTGDANIYAQRVDSAGVPLWTTNGVAVCDAPNLQNESRIASDGAGGAIIVWRDNRNGTPSDLYAQGIEQGGVPAWTANGVSLPSL